MFKKCIFASILYHTMSSKIRKLTLSYPFAIDNRQQRTVFTVDDKIGTNNEKSVHTITEDFDSYHQKIVYKISVGDGSHVKQWKEIIPCNCSIEIEYYIQ